MKRSRFLAFPTPLVLFALFFGCALDVDTHDQGAIETDRDCIRVEGLCGGCDPACRMVRDRAVSDDDVDTDGDDRNGEDVVFDPDLGGVVIGSAHGFGEDTDGDGIPDSSDPSPEDPHGDADGDGIPDAWELHRGTDPLSADPPPPEDEWYMVLSQDGGPVWRDIPPDIPLTVRSADVYFLVDVTGSMGGEIANLRSTLTSFIIPNIQALIDDVHFGVGRYADYIQYSSAASDEPFVHLVDITDDTTAVIDAIDHLSLQWGADGPESQTAALHAVATGAGLDTSCGGRGPATCPPGHTGYPCFRPGAQPIIINFTDNAFHNGVFDTIGRASPYGYTYGSVSSYHCTPLSPACPSLETVVDELRGIGAYHIGVWSGSYPYREYGHVSAWSSPYRSPLRWPTGMTSTAYSTAVRMIIDLYYTSMMTDTVDEFGYPLVYKIGTDGTGLGMEVVNAVSDLVDMMLLQVNSRWVDMDPAAPDGSVLIRDVDPVWCSHCGSLNHATNTAHDVYPGSSVTFQVHMENTSIPPGPEPQEFDIEIQILNNDTAILATRIVHVLVPGEFGMSVPGTDGRWWQDYDSRISCAAGEIPLWDQLYWEAETPAGTSITYRVYTSDTFAGLDTAMPITVARIPGEDPPGDVEEALAAAGIPNNQRYMRMEALLHTETPGITPVLTETTVVFYCITP